MFSDFLKDNYQIDDILITKFLDYLKLLSEWNERFNLTAITSEEGILEKHFIDSILPMQYIDFSNKTLCDIGTGAGFPGIPLAICNPSLNVTLIESNGKKVSFLEEVKKVLSLDNVFIYKVRAEEFDQRELFDYVSARAVTKLNVLLELGVPLLKINGQMLAYKLFDVEEEINESKHALKVLDCKLECCKKYELPFSKDKRSLVIVSKLNKTKNKYPRDFASISKSPL